MKSITKRDFFAPKCSRGETYAKCDAMEDSYGRAHVTIRPKMGIGAVKFGGRGTRWWDCFDDVARLASKGRARTWATGLHLLGGLFHLLREPDIAVVLHAGARG